MNKQFKDFNELIAEAGDYLQTKKHYSGYSIGAYRRGWAHMREYMVANGIQCYNREVEKKYLDHTFGARGTKKLTPYEKFLCNGFGKLSEFQETGKMDVPERPPSKYPMVFKGPIGEVVTKFIEHKRVRERLSWIRLHSYQRNLVPFVDYCNKKSITSIGEIDQAEILGYLNGLDCNRKSPTSLRISALRSLLGHAFEQGLTIVDYSLGMPKYRSIGQPKVPSTYSKKEIETLISSLDRSGAYEKRNYAIVLLAARLGLRASDIARLKFGHLDWGTSTLKIQQVKTGRELVLPLLPDVGNAIIDYLKYGRPDTGSPFVFLTGRPPFGHFATSNVVTHIVQRAFRRSGIKIKGRRFGPHALRHSLGFRMLEESTVLPVISEVLGHASTESTRYYLRIDLKSKKQCVLDVPPVTAGFYSQKGGVFYD